MKYRLLNPDEWDRTAALLPEGYRISPAAASAAVAESDTGEIAAVLFLQIQLHMEPIVIKDPSVNFLRLVKVLEDAIRDRRLEGLHYYAFADSPKVERMAELAGLEREPYSVWHRRVG